MNRYSCLRLFPVIVFAAAAAGGMAETPRIPSGERVLFGNGRLTQFSNLKGGEATLDPQTRILSVVLPKADSGVSVKSLLEDTRLDPIPHLGDPAPGVDVVFRSGNQNPPEGIYIVLEAIDHSTKPAGRKTVRTQTVKTAQAESLADGWKLLRIPFDKLTTVTAKEVSEKEWTRRIRIGDGKSPDLTVNDIIERAQIWGTSAGSFEVARVSLVRLRGVSVKVTNDVAKNMTKLAIEGRTSDPVAEVTLKLVDGSGQSHTQVVQAKDGKYQFAWENPPLTAGKMNVLSASVGGGTPLDQAVPEGIFGYLPDTNHVWLSVKGRDIVTSPLSKGGQRPFYSVGAGYGKNVLVKGYDEEVAAYSKSMSLNTLRLAFYTTHFNNRQNEPLAFEDITAFVDPVVDAAKRHGLYVILDDHSYFKNEIAEETARSIQNSSGWTEERFENWVNRWVEVATHYKDEPYILGYELCNEPVCDPETARKWYRRCIDAIRKVDQRHIIIVGSHHWSHARALEATWEGIADEIDSPYNNVAFSFHDYPLDDHPWNVQKYLKAFQAKYNVPVLCTEFGAGGKPERVHREFQAGMLAMFAFDRVGWMIWSIYYDPDRSSGFPTKAVQTEDKRWEVRLENPGYWIPFVELWAPTARIMASAFPEPASAPEKEK